MPEKTFVPCPKCGADLPPEASFCPYCTESFNPRTELHPPRRAWGRVLRPGGGGRPTRSGPCAGRAGRAARAGDAVLLPGCPALFGPCG